MKCILLNYYDTQIPYQQLKCKLRRFSCGEFSFSIQEDVSSLEIIIFQSFTVGQFNDDLIKLQLVCDVLQKNNVQKIILFAPFIPYTRQDKIDNTKVSLGFKLMADIINNFGVTELVTYDLHNTQFDAFCKATVRNLSMIPHFIQDIKQKFCNEKVAIVLPDAGSVLRFKNSFINEPFEIIFMEKDRTKNGVKMHLSGKIDGSIAIIVDDIIDSGNTITAATNILLENNIKRVCAYAAHGVLSKGALIKLQQSPIEKITISNSLKRATNNKMQTKYNKVHILPIKYQF